VRAVATFTVDSFDPSPPHHEADGVTLGRIKISKTFTGELDGSGSVEMLAARAEEGSGYVALELIDAAVAGRRGTFVLMHAATMTGTEPWTKFLVVPGSGTGELRGITGEGRIDIAEDDTHTFTLDYDLPPRAPAQGRA
jgi:hypothetical protein